MLLMDEDLDDLVSPEVADFLARALEEPLPADKDVLVVIVPAPFEALEKFLRSMPRASGFLWRSPGGIQLAGGGATFSLSGAGESRFHDLREGAAQFWPRVHVRSLYDDGIAPALVGGAAFMPGVPDREPWSEFTEDLFVLPRWCYRREGDTAHLMVSATREELAESQAAAIFAAQTRRLLTMLEEESATTLIERPTIDRKAVHHMSLEDWTTYIESIKAAFASGAFEKIVAARRCVVDLPSKLDETAFMARLFAAYADCTHFAIVRERSCFLGATPETLFRKQGNKLSTHALAGTVRVKDDLWSDASVDAAKLANSLKTQIEHNLVTKQICEELANLSRQIRYASTPQIRRVRHLIHLQTPISCELRDDVDPFQLITALHPTPAVGGVPSKAAAVWLRDNEPMERGWYAGTVGWFDADGNAEVAVAIRCGVLTPRRAYIYAGAGIVQASDAEAEYHETAAKLVPILRALGVSL